MQILFLSSWYPNKTAPTNGNFVQRHAEAVATQHLVEVLHAVGDFQQKETYLFEEEEIRNVRTLIVYYRNTKNPLLNFVRRMNAYRRGYQLMFQPDLIHGNILHNNLLFGVYLKIKHKIPLVISEHWSALRAKNQPKTPFLIQKTARFIGNRADCIMPVSEDLKKGLVALGIKTPMRVVPNVVDTSLFHPKEPENQTFRFIHVSNLIPLKNADKILKISIELLEEGCDFSLQIGGDGDTSPLEKILANHPKYRDKIHIFGMKSLPEIAEKMRSSDCFILFSESENQPCVLGEAFASGISVISSNVGGISEFFPEGAGILLPTTDEKLLKQAMIEMLSRPRVNGRFLRNYAEKTFSIPAIAGQFDAVYRMALAQK